MSGEATVMRILCMFFTCFSCAVAQLRTGSIRLTGYDQTLSVQNIPSRYTELCPLHSYLRYLCNKKDVPVQHGNGETRPSVRILEMKRIGNEADIMFGITYSEEVEAENPLPTLTECRLLHDREQDPQLTSQNRWIKPTVQMVPNSTYNFGYLYDATKYDQYSIAFISPRDTVTHLQILLVKVDCNSSGQELVLYMSKKKYKLCRPVKGDRRLIAGKPYAIRSRFTIIAVLKQEDDGFQASVTTRLTVERTVTYNE
ncbi:unnamed protein product [Soboliphyme baturini]|uniref:NTR domain-containing protein n=1 Tax=Soboliphyme baturini TaxID=241478 RepID=A0A183J4S5_9BILA|nr:unnamed protein product [Soboliphyme baturini]